MEREGADLGTEVEAIHLRQADIEEDEVERERVRRGERCAGEVGGDGFQADELHGGHDDFARAVFVIDDEDLGAAGVPGLGAVFLGEQEAEEVDGLAEGA